MGFNAYEIDAATKEKLLAAFPPKYPTVLADHITQNFGVAAGTPNPQPGSVKVVGVADDGRGVQGLIIEVDGQRTRPDGKPFHITWSYDPSKIAPAELDPSPPGKQKAKTYRPAHTNKLVELGQHSTMLETPVEIAVTPKFVEDTPAKPAPARG